MASEPDSRSPQVPPPCGGRLIHTGQALVDLTLEVPGLPTRGDNVMATGVERYAGGAVTVLVAAARAGAAGVLAGTHGRGPNGDLVRETLAREGVTAPAPVIESADTGVCVVVVEPSGERTFITTQGAERRLSVGALDSSEPEPGDVVCLTGYSFVLEATREPLLEWLAGLDDDVVLVLDPGASFAGLDPEVVAAVLARTDVWTGNADEARQEAIRAGVRESAAASSPVGGTASDMLPLAEAVADGLEEVVVVVRDGADGCVVRVDGHSTVVAGYPQKPVDTNGAGDTHTGVLIAGHLAGLDWVEAARRANAAAAIKVTRRGPASSPTRVETDAFLASLVTEGDPGPVQ